MVGTIFHSTKIPLHKWFILISLMLNAKKGLSACQASRDLGIRRMTVWSMMHRVRKAMADNDSLLSGIVEMDETYIGGKPRKQAKKHDDDDDTPLPPINKRGRGTKKECVVGMIERGGKVKAKHVKKTNLKFVDMQKLVRKNVKIDKSILITDEYKAYNRMRQFITHLSVNHKQEYVRGRIHTNTIESFWAIVKRGIVGQFHKVSSKYLYMYIDEFCWRFNNRNNDDRFDDLLMCCVG
jgi:transposase-like protein